MTKRFFKLLATLVLALLVVTLVTNEIKAKATSPYDDDDMTILVLSDGTELTYKGTTDNIMIPREYKNPDTYFRGMWVTPLSGSPKLDTKAGIDEIIEIMEYYNLNALIFHMRMFNDSTYTSSLNPRSSYASLSSDEIINYAISECHKRGIEFHAWLNPYRCASSGVTDITNITKKYASYPNNPASDASNLLMNSNGGVILNPGLPEVRTFIVDSCMEIIEKFDVDAIHFDDYFYISGVNDDETQAIYNTEELSTADFRRKQVDLFIEELHDTMTEYNTLNNRCVQLGISPSGIYRNGDGIVTYDENNHPITNGSKTGGFAHYGDYLYSDTLKWAIEGWIDYLLPQSYWGFSHTIAGYGDVMSWWDKAMRYLDCKLYSGMGIYMAENPGSNYSWGFDPMEAANQVLYATSLDKCEGTVFYVYQYLKYTHDGATNTLYGQGLTEIKNKMFYNQAILPTIDTMEKQEVASPTNINVSFEGSKTTVSFDKVDNAKFYVIFRSKDVVNCTSDEVIKIIGDDEHDRIVFEDTSTGGEKYNYAICAQSHTNHLSDPAYGNLVEYKVTFYNEDGSVLKEEVVKTSESATAPTPPTKDGAEFVGWSKDFSYVTKNLEVYPKYTDSDFYVTFYDGEGNVAKVDTVKYKASATPPVVTRTGYTFVSWSADFSEVTNDLDVYPNFEVKMCKVTFLDWDGTELSSYEIAYGKYLRTPSTPSRKSYSFVGWENYTEQVFDDITLTALYDPIYVTVTFVSDIDGSVIDTKQVLIYTSVELIDAPVVNGYIFIRWMGSIDNVVKDTTIRASYDEIMYNVTILDYYGNVIDEFEYFLADGYEMPEAEVIDGKEFIGWDHDINNLGNDEIDVVIKPLYRSSNITIKFMTSTGELISEAKYSDALTYPTPKTIVGMTFMGWDKELTNILDDTVITALYDTLYITYLGYNDKEIEKRAITEHTCNYYPTITDVVVGYKFDSWDTVLDGLYIDGNITVKAVYKEAKCTVTYHDYYGDIVLSEEIPYGGDASFDLIAPDVDGYRFSGFDSEGKGITRDTVIRLLYNKIPNENTSGCKKNAIMNLISIVSILGLVFVIRKKFN